MFYDTFDSDFGIPPVVDSTDGAFMSPMFNGAGCFPIQNTDMSFVGGNNGFGMNMPLTCGYSPAPFGCDPCSVDVYGNMCIDGIPITPSTPPAWMTARAAQAEMHLNMMEMQFNDPNHWMNIFPPVTYTPPAIDWWNVDWDSIPFNSQVDPFGCNDLMDLDSMNAMNTQTDMDMNPPDGMEMGTPMWKGEEILPCGLTQSQYDQNLNKYQSLLADCERQLENCDPFHTALRAMIQNNIDRINRHIRDLDKPLGTF